jgi:F5/8 type C domain
MSSGPDCYAGHGPDQALDGSSDTYWHTRWGRVEPPYPHVFTIIMGGDTNTLSGLRYTARSDGETNGRIGDYEVRSRVSPVFIPFVTCFGT